MKQAYREIQGKRSRKIRFALLTTIMMAMLVLQACGNNTGGNGASASGDQIRRRREKGPRARAMFQRY